MDNGNNYAFGFHTSTLNHLTKREYFAVNFAVAIFPKIGKYSDDQDLLRKTNELAIQMADDMLKRLSE